MAYLPAKTYHKGGRRRRAAGEGFAAAMAGK
jgi:hypothetical protein